MLWRETGHRYWWNEPMYSQLNLSKQSGSVVDHKTLITLNGGSIWLKNYSEYTAYTYLWWYLWWCTRHIHREYYNNNWFIIKVDRWIGTFKGSCRKLGAIWLLSLIHCMHLSRWSLTLLIVSVMWSLIHSGIWHKPHSTNVYHPECHCGKWTQYSSL